LKIEKRQRAASRSKSNFFKNKNALRAARVAVKAKFLKKFEDPRVAVKAISGKKTQRASAEPGKRRSAAELNCSLYRKVRLPGQPPPKRQPTPTRLPSRTSMRISPLRQIFQSKPWSQQIAVWWLLY
jgi:hypothetical protein